MDLDKKLTSLHEISKTQLSKILNITSSSKDLVLENAVIKPLQRICGVQWLKGNAVDKIFKLEATAPQFKSNTVYYVIYTNMTTFKAVLNQIRSVLDPEKPVQNKFHVIMVPGSTFLYEDALEELGLFDPVIKLHSLQWLPIYIDNGVLSLEYPSFFSNIFVRHDYSLLQTFAKSLWHLFFVTGKPKFTLALGGISNKISTHLDALCEDVAVPDDFDSDFGALIIVDRTADYPSVLLTPGTYAALLNEVYEVNCGFCECKDEELGKYDGKFNPIVKRNPVSFTLDSKQDSVYRDIKNRYFTEVTSVLSNLTKQLKKETASSKEMALDEIKRYVQTQLQATQSKKKFITNHLTAAECIINTIGPRFENQHDVELNVMQNKHKSSNFSYLEEMLSTENDKFLSLRLFCLLCVTQKLSDSDIKSFWRKYVHEFGYKQCFAYDNLINAGFIQESSQSFASALPNRLIKIPKFERNNFYSNANKLRQIPSDPDKIDVNRPTCCSYVFGGAYIPLIAQMASMLLNNAPLDEVRGKLEPLASLSVKDEGGYPLRPRNVLIGVVGGITYAEIAACNLLEVLTGAKIVVLSDRIVTGNDLMKGVLSLPDD